MLIRLLRILAATALLAGAAACGGDDDTASTEDLAAAEETTGDDVGPESDDEPSTAEESSADPETAGHVLIGDRMFDFVPRQCSFFPGGIVSISGTAASDPEVSIVYDVFDEGGQPELSLEVPPDYSASPWTSKSVTALVEGETVSGNAMMVQSGSDGMSLVAFEFRCG